VLFCFLSGKARAGGDIMLRRRSIKKTTRVIRWHSERYEKWVKVPKDFWHDGATVVKDVHTEDGALHDWCFFAAIWEDGSRMTFEEANDNYTDWLKEKHYWFRAQTRKALHYVGRSAWNEHRRREMIWHNMKFLHEVPH